MKCPKIGKKGLYHCNDFRKVIPFYRKEMLGLMPSILFQCDRSNASAVSNFTVFIQLLQGCQPERSANYISLSKDSHFFFVQEVCLLPPSPQFRGGSISMDWGGWKKSATWMITSVKLTMGIKWVKMLVLGDFWTDLLLWA